MSAIVSVTAADNCSRRSETRYWQAKHRLSAQNEQRKIITAAVTSVATHQARQNSSSHREQLCTGAQEANSAGAVTRLTDAHVNHARTDRNSQPPTL